ncbi:hypothetical protein FHS96_001351 [Sphingomonas zeicaulis]|uniref:hypothetical protein n=1 Tax=Sphingomonas zeicaulis TaxID=1632740 RepID=UPI003D19F1D6
MAPIRPHPIRREVDREAVEEGALVEDRRIILDALDPQPERLRHVSAAGTSPTVLRARRSKAGRSRSNMRVRAIAFIDVGIALVKVRTSQLSGRPPCVPTRLCYLGRMA